jgi:hypothetical protein
LSTERNLFPATDFGSIGIFALKAAAAIAICIAIAVAVACIVESKVQTSEAVLAGFGLTRFVTNCAFGKKRRAIDGVFDIAACTTIHLGLGFVAVRALSKPCSSADGTCNTGAERSGRTPSARFTNGNAYTRNNAAVTDICTLRIKTTFLTELFHFVGLLFVTAIFGGDDGFLTFGQGLFCVIFGGDFFGTAVGLFVDLYTEFIGATGLAFGAGFGVVTNLAWTSLEEKRKGGEREQA